MLSFIFYVLRCVLCIASFFYPYNGLALVFALPSASSSHTGSNSNPVLGSIQRIVIEAGDTLSEVGRSFNVGFDEVVAANPSLDPNKPLAIGTQLVMPSRFVLPPTVHEGIVINLPELRLYYYFYDNRRLKVMTEPVGIGKIGWQTPVGTTKVIQKTKNPSWYPPSSVRAEANRIGYPLPNIVPPGPDNPLGHYAMRLGWRTYLIHGTNRPDGVGKRSSAGCLRLFPEGIEKLYQSVSVDTPVTIVNEPIKLGRQGSNWFIEVHKPIEEKGAIRRSDLIKWVDRLQQLSVQENIAIRWQTVQKAFAEKRGYPIVIATKKDKTHGI